MNKVVATQIIFLILAIVGFFLAKAGASGVATGDTLLFTIGMIMLVAAVMVQIALVMIPVVKAIVEKFKDKE